MASSIVSITKGKDGKICVKFKSIKDRVWLLKQLEKREEKEVETKKTAKSEPKPSGRARLAARENKDYILTKEGTRVKSLSLNDPTFARIHHERNIKAARKFDKATEEKRIEKTKEQAKNYAEAVAAETKRLKELDKADRAEKKRSRAEAKELKELSPAAAIRRDIRNLHLPKAVSRLGLPPLPHIEHKHEESDLDSAEEGDDDYEGDGMKGLGSIHTTYDDQINKLLKPIKGFQGCFSSDQVGNVKISPTEDTSFVMNTDPASKPGQHWVAVWISPVKSKSVEVFDSLAKDSPLNLKALTESLRTAVDKLHLPYRLKFKHNTVRDQRANSSTCGVFASKFILDRARTGSFAEASHYTGISEAEKSLRPLEEEFKYL